MPKCPKHEKELDECPITKGYRIIGRNLFCPERNCDFEIDDFKKKMIKGIPYM